MAFRDLSPRQIVPLLADEGQYLASESTFYRVLREAGQLAHRSPARPARAHKPKEHIAHGPNEVWSWDITICAAPSEECSFISTWSSMCTVGKSWVGRVHLEENAEARCKADSECHSQRGGRRPEARAWHADNGGPMKGSTMLATLQRLGVIASFSRAHVSDDNPFAEALFRT